MTSLVAAWRDTSRTRRLTLALFALALCAAGAAAAVVLPARGRLAALQAQQGALQQQVVQARATAARLARGDLERAGREQRLAAIARRLPAEREIPALYRALHDAARESGLAVALFQPRDPRGHDFYTEVPIAMIAEGTYHQVGLFLERLSALPRIVAVSAIKLTGIERPPASLRAELTLASYVYRAPDAAAVLPESPQGVAPRHHDASRFSARGRRDPFTTPSFGATGPAADSRAAITSATLTGIVRGPDGPLALVETADGTGHVLRPGDDIGGGRVLRIETDSVIVAMRAAPGVAGGQITLALGSAK